MVRIFRLMLVLLYTYIHTYIYDGFGGLVVSMLASGTQVREFKPGRSRWIFTGVKILSMQHGFEPTISAGEGPKTYTLDRAATGIGEIHLVLISVGG